MTSNYQRTLSDIDLIIEQLDSTTKNKIPQKMQKFIHENKLENYTPQINTNIPLEEQVLHKDTKVFLAMLYLNYFCTTQEEKEEFKSQLNQNEIKYQKELEEKYSIDNIFKKTKEEVIEEPAEEENLAMIEYKESIIKRILNKIFSFFRRK